MTMSIGGSAGLTFPDSTTQTTSAFYGGLGFRNRIINGAMMIDQRNAGASVTPADGAYTLDRFIYNATQSSKVTIQQNAGSVTPPAGFTNYLGVTSSSAYSVGSGDFFTIGQRIEGLNVADLGWGTANASAVTLSFKVYSSLTGTFGGSLTNSAINRSYPFTYTISSANTWTTISVTVAGDTSGTWLTTNGIGLRIYFGLGAGSTYSGTAGSWSGSTYLSATGATSVVGTNGATFYITGVQLEKGSTATSFDYRPYGTELALCERYTKVYGGEGTYQSVGGYSIATSSTGVAYYTIALNTKMRSSPSFSYSGNWRIDDGYTASYSITGITANGISNNSSQPSVTLSVASGLTAGRAYLLQANNDTTAKLILSAEL